MKEKIHPQFGAVLFTCASCGTEHLIESTRVEGAKREHQGREYPSMALEICSQCHPYFSGKQMYVDTAGRVEKFQRRYGSLTGKKPEAKPAAQPKGEGEPAAAATASAQEKSKGSRKAQ